MGGGGFGQVEEALAWAAEQAGARQGMRARGRADTSGASGFTALTKAQAEVVEAMTARILPAVDGRPGAREAGAIHFIDKRARHVQRGAEDAVCRGRGRSRIDAPRPLPVRRNELRRADARAAGRAAARDREDAVLPDRALRHASSARSRCRRGAAIATTPAGTCSASSTAVLPAAVRLLRRRRQPEGADDAEHSRNRARAFPSERDRRLRDRRIRRGRRHPRQGALDRRLLGGRARTGAAADRGAVQSRRVRHVHAEQARQQSGDAAADVPRRRADRQGAEGAAR